MTSSVGSYEPGIHVAPQPCSSACPTHVSDPGSPRLGIEYHRHTRSPVDARYASRNPRAPSSPPATPSTSRSPTGRGGDVVLYDSRCDPISTSHKRWPVNRLNASRCAWSVTTNALSPAMVTPRFAPEPPSLRMP